jgi:hypothetical protein
LHWGGAENPIACALPQRFEYRINTQGQNMNIRIGAVAAGALVLVACGQAVPSDLNSVNGSPAAEAPSQVEGPTLEESSTSVSTKADEIKAPSDRLLGHKVYTPEEALGTEVMGLKVGMSLNDVLATLEMRDFEPVVPDSQKSNHEQMGLETLVGDYQFECRLNFVLCRPGSMQEMRQDGFVWKRSSGDDEYEVISPLFYLDADRQPKLHYVRYMQYYGRGSSPPDVINAMIDRFGEPTLDDSSVSREGIQTGRLRYYIQMPIPEGLVPAKVDTREKDLDVEQQHPVLVTRFSCLNDQYRNIAVELSPECKNAMNGDSQEHWMFEALARGGKLGVPKNKFLEIEYSNKRLTIELIGEVLPEAIDKERQEAQLRQRVEERKAQLEQTYDAPSDL